MVREYAVFAPGNDSFSIQRSVNLPCSGLEPTFGGNGGSSLNLLNPSIPPQTVSATRLRAIVLDWAGTTIDFGSVAPARTIQQLFSRRNITLTEQETRRDMGLPKKDHIGRILSIPRIREAWKEQYGRSPAQGDVDQVYAEFIPMQFSCLAEYSSVIPGVPEAVEGFRKRGLKIGSTTGYTRAMLDQLIATAAKEGYSPDCSLAPEEVGAGRPQPFMMYECAVRLQTAPLAAFAKIGDTPADILEGLNAGAWSIGVAATGNAIGLTRCEYQALSESERQRRLAGARTELEQAGAHYVVDTLDEVGPVLDDIDARLEATAEFDSAKVVLQRG
jgi:phosphonoacetaldehyde hydrolase